MKIGIITQSLRVNYGGILQNYALQKVLKNKGYDVVTIDQPCENEKYYRMVLSALRTFILKLFRKGGKRKYPTDICKRYRNFVSKNIQKFINEHIVFSEQLIDYEETKEYVVNHKIDAIIVGSDQVWRPKFVKDIYHSYIDFAEKLDVKRIAYAASFGVDNWEYNDIQTQRCSSLIKKFIGVSVRELSGIELCRKYLDVEAQLVLDPTLLLKSEDYMYLIKNENTTYKGIGVYLLDFNEEKMNFIAELAAQSGKNVFYIGKPNDNGVLPSIESWIKGFTDADMIITDSFHGSVFSIIFNKEFYSLVNVKRGASRFYSLLNVLGLEKRMVYAPYKLEERLSINWGKVNERVKELRKESIEFIDKCLL